MRATPIDPLEIEIIGRWTFENGVVVADEACFRIDKLVREYLVEVAISPIKEGWVLLFRDPADGRYWEQVFLESELQGGGPPSLRCIDTEQAGEKYGWRQ
jgi:hypothetical protein